MGSRASRGRAWLRACRSMVRRDRRGRCARRRRPSLQASRRGLSQREWPKQSGGGKATRKARKRQRASCHTTTFPFLVALPTHLLHLGTRLTMRTPRNLGVDLLAIHTRQQLHILWVQHLIIRLTFLFPRQSDFADARDKSDDLHAMSLEEVLFGDRSGGDSTDRFPCTRSTTTRRRLEAVFREVRVIRVRRSRVQIRLCVIVRSLILVVDEQSNRRTQRHTMLQPRLDVNGIVF